MQLAMIGLGRMGYNMALRLTRGGHRVTAFNRSPAKTGQLADEVGRDGVLTPAYSLEEAVDSLESPRTVWLMLPAGQVVDDHLDALTGLLQAGDTVIEGGNSNFKDAGPRAEKMAAGGVNYLDAGVSGGVWGLSEGYCLMVGGSEAAFEAAGPIFRTLAPAEGLIHAGPVGAGHFVKMIHNGIEYGMMQAYGEGFDLLKNSPYGQGLDLAELAHVWNRGSVVRSWLLELAEAAFSEDPGLEGIRGRVADSGEGRWTVNHAVDSGVNAPVITLALMNRFRSQREDTFGDRVLAALRNQFGGHAVVGSGEKD